MDEKRIKEILINACEATSAPNSVAPQPYGHVVAELYEEAAGTKGDADHPGDVLMDPSLVLYLIARLLEAACAAEDE